MNVQGITNMQKITRPRGARPGVEPAAREPAKIYEYLSDADVLLLVKFHRENPDWSLRRLALKFEVSTTCVARILKGWRRADVTGIEPKAKRSW